MSAPAGSTPERPGRYDRSFGGLLAAMVATVLLIGAFVGFRALVRDQPDGAPQPVDYLQDVRDLQGADVTVVYPRDLPSGWVPTSVRYDRGEHPGWGVGMVTAAGDFVGLRQEQAPVEELLHRYVDDNPVPGADAHVASVFGDVWHTWSDGGGDHAFAMTVGTGPLAGVTVLVYGSAPTGDQEELIQLLATDRLSR